MTIASVAACTSGRDFVSLSYCSIGHSLLTEEMDGWSVHAIQELVLVWRRNEESVSASACASAVSNALLSHLQNAMLSTCNFLK